MFSTVALTSAAMSASASMASSVNSSVTPSVCISADVLLDEARLGLGQDAHASPPCVSGFSSTRIGSRPCSSGSRSEGLATWKAPEAMNSTWSVFTGPYLVDDRGAFDQRQQVALHALARDVGADPARSRARDLVDLVEEHDAVVLDGAYRVLHDLVLVEQLVALPGQRGCRRPGRR